uniref:pentapeptide repeat-containing protein n=1 Tax=Arthrobacter globiformis TaxID=1665 RepID=UPI00358DF91A
MGRTRLHPAGLRRADLWGTDDRTARLRRTSLRGTRHWSARLRRTNLRRTGRRRAGHW